MDYKYRAPDLDAWLRENSAPKVITLQAAFEAGQRYGADLQRGAFWQSLEELDADAADDGTSLTTRIREDLLEYQAEESRQVGVVNRELLLFKGARNEAIRGHSIRGPRPHISRHRPGPRGRPRLQSALRD